MNIADQAEAAQKKLVSVSLGEILSLEFPKQDAILGPWLLRQSLNMVFAWRGIGKTHFALNVAHAAACGGSYLGWQAGEPSKVLYLDGEMPGSALQQRLANIVQASSKTCDPDFFRFITPDLQRYLMPDLATHEGQEQIEEHIAIDTRLIVVDNLSALARRGGRENDAESWLNVGEWAMHQRASGRAVLFVHHSGKDGRQRGTSKREDILDTVLCLSRPSDYNAATDGARFVVEFQKDRHNLAGEPFEAKLDSGPNGEQFWTTRSAESSRMTQAIELAELGLTVTDIAAELGVNKSTVSRMLKKAEDEGLYRPKRKGKGRDGNVIDLKSRRRRDIDD